MLSSDVISRIIRFGASGLPIVSLYVTVSAADAPSAVRTRMGSLLDQIRPITEDDLNRDARVVAEAFENAASTGLGAIGIDDSLWAGSCAAIEALLIEEGTTVPGVVRNESGWFARSAHILRTVRPFHPTHR